MYEQIAKYLANEMNEEERQSFEGLLVEDTSLQEELYAQIALSNTNDQSLPSFETHQAFKKIEGRISAEEIRLRPNRSFSLLKIAATLLIVLSAGFLLNEFLVKDKADQQIAFATDQQIDAFELPDGTFVKLNANSVLTLAKGFNAKNREVYLEGAANFEVTSNTSLPFVINANKGSVEVVGTVFEVNAYPEKEVELNVAEGKVRFASKVTQKEDLFIAGDRGILTADGTQLTKSTQKNENYAAWWTNRLVFEDAPLNEVFADLEKTYHVEIDYDKALSNCPWGTILENYTLTEALEALKTTFPNISKIEIKDSHIKLEGTACND